MLPQLRSRPLSKATLWMTGTLFAFTLMAVAGRELSSELNTFQILLFRSLISLLLIAIWLSIFGWQQIQTKHFKVHGARNTAHFIGQYGWFYGIALMPLAEVFAIEFTVPIWTAVIATLLLKESMNLGRSCAITLGFAGVILILGPGREVVSGAAFVVLIGAISYALAHTLTKKISAHDSPACIIFYMSLLQLPLSLIPCLLDWKTPCGTMWLWLVVIALCALIAHYCLAQALTLADATVVIPLDFLRLPLIALVGFLLYNEAIDWLVLAGAGLMLLGNLINLHYEQQTPTQTN